MMGRIGRRYDSHGLDFHVVRAHHHEHGLVAFGGWHVISNRFGRSMDAQSMSDGEMVYCPAYAHSLPTYYARYGRALPIYIGTA